MEDLGEPKTFARLTASAVLTVNGVTGLLYLLLTASCRTALRICFEAVIIEFNGISTVLFFRLLNYSSIEASFFGRGHSY